MTGVRALLLVDLQHDFLDRPHVVPTAADVVGRCAHLLAAFRSAALPIVHIRTAVRPDGSDAMPHRRAAGAVACVIGTHGGRPPDVLVERPGEFVTTKQHYRGFGDPALDGWLRDQGTTGVVVAGLYTHACVRETVLDAYERGYDVVVAADAVASDDPGHADATYRWLSTRAADFRCTAEVVGTLRSADAPRPADQVQPVVDAAVAAQPSWAHRPVAERVDTVNRWARELTARSDVLAEAIVADVHKPVTAARAEVARAIDLALAAGALGGSTADERVGDGVVARVRPAGVVGLILPWNNPLALPVGKIAPAIVLGDAVVLKPAPEAARTTAALVATLAAVGVPDGLVGVATGGPRVGAALVRAPGVDVVAVTGSIPTGRAITAECARLGRGVQAELGGNNAAVVLADADLDVVVPALVRNAFAFAGQRCTAIRRFVVDRSILDRFVPRAIAATTALRLGDPTDPATDVGPMISWAAAERVASVVADAVTAGAGVLCGGGAPAPAPGRATAYLEPTLLLVEDPTADVVRAETFGPVAVIVPVDGEAEAIAVADGVDQGLIIAVCTTDPAAATRVLDAANAGIVQWGPQIVPVHPEAPFGGWKASGYGPPEHGRWDALHLGRTQALYVAEPPT